MSIQLNYNVSKSVRPGQNTFGVPVTNDVSGLQRAGEALGKLGQQAGKIAEVYEAQDRAAQNLLAMKSYSALTEDANTKATALEAAIANGNNDLVKQAQKDFDSLKDKSILDYIPDNNSGVEITRDSVLTNYGTQYTQLYGGLSRKLSKQKASQYSKNVILDETRSQESDIVNLNVKYGKNPIPLNEISTFTGKHFNTQEDTEAYNALATNTLKEAYLNNKVELFTRLLNKSLRGVRTELDFDTVSTYYDALFTRYDLFQNSPDAESKYKTIIEKAQDEFNKNKLALAKDGAKRDLDLVSKSVDTIFKSDTLPTSNAGLILLDKAMAAVQLGVKDVDYSLIEDGNLLIDFYTTDPDNFLKSGFTNLLQYIARIPPDERVDVSQYFGAEVNGELVVMVPELMQISSDNKTRLENHVKGFIAKFDSLMEKGDGLMAMASIDPLVQKLLKENKIPEANLYIQNEYVDKGVFRGRGFPSFFANISTEGYTKNTSIAQIKKSVLDMLSNNQGNLEAFYNNIVTRQSKGASEEAIANMDNLLTAILPNIIQNGYSVAAVDQAVNDFIEPQRLYEAADKNDRAKVDNVFNTLADHQISYHKEEAGDNLFGEFGLRKEIQLMNLYAEGNAAQRQFAEDYVKGYLYQEIIVNKKSPEDAVASLQEKEQATMPEISPTIVETFGSTFSIQLPAEADDIILKGVGENQFTGLREFWFSVTGNKEELQRSKRAEVARNYSMATIALYAMSGMETSQFQSYLKAFGLERDFDVTDPVFWNANTGMPTRQGLESIIKGIMSNEVDGQSIAKLSGHSYKYDNGELKKYPRLAFKSGTGYSEVEIPELFDVEDILNVVKTMNLGDNVIYDLRFPFGRGGEAMDRLLDILEETGAIGDVPLEQILNRAYSPSVGYGL